MLKIKGYPLGPIQTNCYIVQDDEGFCIIIDPGEEGSRIVSKVKKEGLTPLAILLTHAHFDHIGAVDTVRDKFHIPVYIHKDEADWLGNPTLNGSARYPGLPLVKNKNAENLIAEDGEMKIGPFTFEVRHTPGHSPGSVSYIFEQGRFAVVGDTLFNGSVGRTDLPGGNTALLLSSIHEKLLTLGNDYVIYPGHGPSTTTGKEQDTNPFLNGF
jgi:hydroxyacylglutathione hydrolase